MRRRNSIPEPLRSELRGLMVKAREEQDRQREVEEELDRRADKSS